MRLEIPLPPTPPPTPPSPPTSPHSLTSPIRHWVSNKPCNDRILSRCADGSHVAKVLAGLVVAFFPGAPGCWRKVRRILFPHLRFKRRIVRAYQFRSLYQDQSTVAQRAETTTGARSLTSCVRARFPNSFSLLCLDDIVSPFRPRWVKGACVFNLTVCHLRFALNDRGLLRATAVTRERNGHPTRVSTES